MPLLRFHYVTQILEKIYNNKVRHKVAFYRNEKSHNLSTSVRAHWTSKTPTVVVQGIDFRVPIDLRPVCNCVLSQVLQKYTARPA